MRQRRHQPIPEQGRWLAQVARGYFAFHAVPTNHAALGDSRAQAVWLWRRSLRRRSQRDDTVWTRVAKLADDYLPEPRILHPRPSEWFAAKHPR